LLADVFVDADADAADIMPMPFTLPFSFVHDDIIHFRCLRDDDYALMLIDADDARR